MFTFLFNLLLLHIYASEQMQLNWFTNVVVLVQYKTVL